MTNSEIFRKAHAMARATVRDGDNYQITFAACLKVVRAPKAKQTAKVDLGSVAEWVLIATVMILATAGLVSVMYIIAAAGHAIAAAVIGAAVITPMIIDEAENRLHAKRIRAL